MKDKVVDFELYLKQKKSQMNGDSERKINHQEKRSILRIKKHSEKIKEDKE